MEITQESSISIQSTLLNNRRVDHSISIVLDHLFNIKVHFLQVLWRELYDHSTHDIIILISSASFDPFLFICSLTDFDHK